MAYRRRRRNPSIAGADIGEIGGAAIGLVATGYVASAARPFLSGILGSLGSLSMAAEGVAAAWLTHWGIGKINRNWARRTGIGSGLYAGTAVLNAVAPGVLPITVGQSSLVGGGTNPIAGLLGGARPSQQQQAAVTRAQQGQVSGTSTISTAEGF